MITRTDDIFHVVPASGNWEARHAAGRLSGPQNFLLGGRELWTDAQESLNGMPFASAVVKGTKAGVSAGCAVVKSAGHFPFGNQIGLEQQSVYAANHALVTADLKWPAQTFIRRHFGLGSVRAPGAWTRFFCLPPAQQQAEGRAPYWQAIPKAPADKPLMIGHWHRPPPAIVLENAAGVRLEFGTGSDLWRWEYSLGHGPESGSYKLMLDAGGITFIREPLMCCAEFAPPVRTYRLTWYAAWTQKHAAAPEPSEELVATGLDAQGNLDKATLPAEGAPILLDFSTLPAQDLWRRAEHPLDMARETRGACLCWETDSAQKRARNAIRQLRTLRPGGGELVIRGATPGVCWDGSHLGKRPGSLLAHWDINALFDFSEWSRKQLGTAWEISAESAGPWAELPSVRGLFAPNGFEEE